MNIEQGGPSRGLFTLSLRVALLICCALTPMSGKGPKDRLVDGVDWAAFLARHDLVWKGLPRNWQEGAFLGNGLLGAMIYQRERNGLVWDLGRTDVIDRRAAAQPLDARPRLPVGRLRLVTAAKVTGGTARLDLWNAEAHGSVQTEEGEFGWRSFVHAEQPIIIIEIAGAAPGVRFQFQPELSVNPRKISYQEPLKEADFNPMPRIEDAGNARVSVQERTTGGEYAVAWREARVADRCLIFVSIADSFPTRGARDQAVQAVDRAAEQGIDSLRATHRAWWRRYYPASFVSIPDTRLESFYWIQMYKLGSATRADRPVIDTMGPWYSLTYWPAIWWNLNIQLCYWPVYTSNRLHLGESLLRIIDENAPNLANNVPPRYRADSSGIGRVSSYDAVSPLPDPETAGKWVPHEMGNLVWALHNYWLHYRHVMDDKMLRERLYAALKRAVNYYLHLLREEDDGRLHLPEALSPEYPKTAADLNYDLALLRWGCQTLLQSAKRLNIDDPLIPKWRDTLARLTPYPVGESGFLIGRNQPLAVSHRHFSHLLMIYPLHLVNAGQPGNRELIERSLRHWIGFKGALMGYSYIGASCISSVLGDGEHAAGYLNQFIAKHLKPNTMYLEGIAPVTETPLAAAQAIHDMLIQSWDGTIRVFPAIPAAWRDVAFHNLRTEGGFLVSAARKGGRLEYVRIESLAGEPCRLKADGPLTVSGGRRVRTRATSDGAMEIDLRKGESVLLATSLGVHQYRIEPVAAQPERTNWFGSGAVGPAVARAQVPPRQRVYK